MRMRTISYTQLEAAEAKKSGGKSLSPEQEAAAARVRKARGRRHETLVVALVVANCIAVLLLPCCAVFHLQVCSHTFLLD